MSHFEVITKLFVDLTWNDFMPKWFKHIYMYKSILTIFAFVFLWLDLCSFICLSISVCAKILAVIRRSEGREGGVCWRLGRCNTGHRTRNGRANTHATCRTQCKPLASMLKNHKKIIQKAFHIKNSEKCTLSHSSFRILWPSYQKLIFFLV